ncbi:SIR2 family protein [Magnetospira thiophila]
MTDFGDILTGVRDGVIVPYLGPGVLSGVTEVGTGQPMPADSDSLILAMNDGKPMAPRLMYEFPRAAMSLELKKGRTFLTKFFTELYGERQWTRSPVHDWLAAVRPPYVIDVNRDTQLQDSYADTPHLLIHGVARISGTAFRYRLYTYDGTSYTEILQEEADTSLPVLFKPMGSPRPDANYVASDADYVDFITELMGGFAIPSFLKQDRQGKKYLLLGLPLNRDTERMVLSDMIHGHAEPTGWALIPHPTDKEKRFCAKLGLEVIESDCAALLAQMEQAA